MSLRRLRKTDRHTLRAWKTMSLAEVRIVLPPQPSVCSRRHCQWSVASDQWCVVPACAAQNAPQMQNSCDAGEGVSD